MLSDLPYFNTATDFTDIDAAWDTWLQHYNKSVSGCVPQVNVRKSNAPMWFDSEVRHMSSKKNIVWKIAKASDLKEDWDKFKKIRNKLKSLLKKKYSCFVANLEKYQKVILKYSGPFLEIKRKVNHYLVKFKTILLALQTHKARRVCLTTILNLYLSK